MKGRGGVEIKHTKESNSLQLDQNWFSCVLLSHLPNTKATGVKNRAMSPTVLIKDCAVQHTHVVLQVSDKQCNQLRSNVREERVEGTH